MDNESTEVSLVEHSALVKKVEDHLSVVLFTKDNMDADKPVPVVNIPHVGYIGGTTMQ